MARSRPWNGPFVRHAGGRGRSQRRAPLRTPAPGRRTGAGGGIVSKSPDLRRRRSARRIRVLSRGRTAHVRPRQQISAPGRPSLFVHIARSSVDPVPWSAAYYDAGARLVAIRQVNRRAACVVRKPGPMRGRQCRSAQYAVTPVTPENPGAARCLEIHGRRAGSRRRPWVVRTRNDEADYSRSRAGRRVRASAGSRRMLELSSAKF